MTYFAINVRTGGEDDFIRRAVHGGLPRGRRLFAPKRLLSERKGGATVDRLLTVFPGYVFLEVDGERLDEDTRWSLRRVEGFFRFLRETSAPSPLAEADRRILLHFISFGEYADKSKVRFDENDRIVVLEGPMKGLEGRIEKVDRRRGRAKIALDICAEGFLIDLGFETVDRAPEGGGDAHGEDG